MSRARKIGRLIWSALPVLTFLMVTAVAAAQFYQWQELKSVARDVDNLGYDTGAGEAAEAARGARNAAQDAADAARNAAQAAADAREASIRTERAIIYRY